MAPPTLRRGGGRLALFADGTAISTADVPGSVSRNAPFGVHIGRRMDSRAYFSGAIDDVHVWDRTLTGKELATASPASASRGTVLRLPMDQVSGSN